MSPQTRKISEDQCGLLQAKIAELGARLGVSGQPKLQRDRDHAELLQTINQHTRLVRDLARQPLITGAGR